MRTKTTMLTNFTILMKSKKKLPPIITQNQTYKLSEKAKKSCTQTAVTHLEIILIKTQDCNMLRKCEVSLIYFLLISKHSVVIPSPFSVLRQNTCNHSNTNVFFYKIGTVGSR